MWHCICWINQHDGLLKIIIHSKDHPCCHAANFAYRIFPTYEGGSHYTQTSPYLIITERQHVLLKDPVILVSGMKTTGVGTQWIMSKLPRMSLSSLIFETHLVNNVPLTGLVYWFMSPFICCDYATYEEQSLLIGYDPLCKHHQPPCHVPLVRPRMIIVYKGHVGRLSVEILKCVLVNTMITPYNEQSLPESMHS